MNTVLIFGAGKSSLYLIEYLARYAGSHDLILLVCDRDTSYARNYISNQSKCIFKDLDISDSEKTADLIGSSLLVVSLLPASLHIQIARICLRLRRHLATASYISDEMRALDGEVRKAGLIFLNECGLDPGIDHMSAMMMIDGIRSRGGVITGFKSYCGGLVADEDDGDNPWRYKFSWNPRNVVLAAQGAPALFLTDGSLQMRPYHRVFAEPEKIDVQGYGTLEAYPNRDSMVYTGLYGLAGLRDMLRGTLRKPGYCKSWNVFVQLGMTDDSTMLEFSRNATLNDYLMTFTGTAQSLREQIQQQTGCMEEDLEKLEWLGLFSDDPLPLIHGTSAQILEALLVRKWKLMPDDRDLVVMYHEITYVEAGRKRTLEASLVLNGTSGTHTAMARTVGLPLAIACRLILEGKVLQKGVIAPVFREIYEPVMHELGQNGIHFTHREQVQDKR